MDGMDGEGEEELYDHIWLRHSVTQSIHSEKNSEKKSIKMFSPHDKIPVCTCNTAGTGHGMPRFVKIQHRTRTRATRDPITVGIPIPVMNPKPFKSLGLIVSVIQEAHNIGESCTPQTFIWRAAHACAPSF